MNSATLPRGAAPRLSLHGTAPHHRRCTEPHRTTVSSARSIPLLLPPYQSCPARTFLPLPILPSKFPSRRKRETSPHFADPLPHSKTLAHPPSPPIRLPRAASPPASPMAGERPPGDPPRPKTSDDRRASPGDAQRPPSRGEVAVPSPSYLPAWTSLYGLYDRMGLQELVGMVRERLSTSGGNAISPSGVQETTTLTAADLPRLSLYNNVVYGPSISHEEETKLLEQLDYLLKQADAYVGAMDGQPDMKLEEHQVSNKIDPGFFVPESPGMWKHYGAVTRRLSSASRVDAQQFKEEKQSSRRSEAVHRFSDNMKTRVAVFAQNKHISPEFAHGISQRIDCLDEYMKQVMEISGFCFSYAGLEGMLTIPEWVTTGPGQVSYYTAVLRKLMTIAECVVDNVGTSPGQYRSIGKEARSILTEDFSFQKLKMNSDPYETASFGVGAERHGGETITQILMKFKGGNNSLFLLAKSVAGHNVAANAVGGVAANGMAAAPHVENDFFSAKLSLDKLYGKDLKTLIQVPFPSLNAKIDMEAMYPYLAHGGGITFHRSNDGNDGLRRYPTINWSGLIGVKCFGAGGEVTYDAERNQVKFAAGIAIRSSLSAISLTFTQPGTYRASVCQKLIDSTMTVAADASYSREAGEDQGLNFTVGLKHSIHPELYLKARAGTAGIGVALKRSWYAGKCTFKLAADVNYNQWRRPKFGVVVSVRS